MNSYSLTSTTNPVYPVLYSFTWCLFLFATLFLTQYLHLVFKYVYNKYVYLTEEFFSGMKKKENTSNCKSANFFFS